MGGDLATLGPAEAKSALSWWLDAGVDIAIQEEERDWLAPPALRGPAATPVPANVRVPDPTSLEALKAWLATGADIPLASESSRRALPHGPEQAEVMLLSEAPGGADVERPIGGDEWLLAIRMIAAIGFAPEQMYSASLSCVFTPGKRMTRSEREFCAEIARHHIRLAKPRRLILLSDGPAQALLGKPLAGARGHIHKVEGVRTIATFHPRHLIHRPLDKPLAWKDLLLLMEEAP